MIYLDATYLQQWYLRVYCEWPKPQKHTHHEWTDECMNEWMDGWMDEELTISMMYRNERDLNDSHCAVIYLFLYGHPGQHIFFGYMSALLHTNTHTHTREHTRERKKTPDPWSEVNERIMGYKKQWQHYTLRDQTTLYIYNEQPHKPIRPKEEIKKKVYTIRYETRRHDTSRDEMMLFFLL